MKPVATTRSATGIPTKIRTRVRIRKNPAMIQSAIVFQSAYSMTTLRLETRRGGP